MYQGSGLLRRSVYPVAGGRIALCNDNVNYYELLRNERERYLHDKWCERTIRRVSVGQTDLQRLQTRFAVSHNDEILATFSTNAQVSDTNGKNCTRWHCGRWDLLIDFKIIIIMTVIVIIIRSRFILVGNVVGRINEVNQRRAWLVLGWVTVCGRVNVSVRNQPPRSTQPGHPSVGRRNEYQRKLGRKRAHREMH